MPEKVPYGERYWYDHMAATDVPVWGRFVAAYPDYFDKVQYDFPVGDVPDHAMEPVVDGGGTMAKLYQRRIDVIGYSTAIIWVVEIKPVADGRTVGQVLQYKHLYDRDIKPATETRALVVCGAVDPDTREFAASQGVSIIVVAEEEKQPK